MNDAEQRWKDKYLASLEQQEKLEQRWGARLDLLRRGLVRSSLAAEGADKAVDKCMQDLREVLRHDDMDAGLSSLIPRLEKSVLDSEVQRQRRVEQASAALASLAAELLKLELPSEVRKPLKSYAKQLAGRAGQLSELPILLAELSQLQQQAMASLGEAHHERPGLLQRLFAGRDNPANAAPAEAAEKPAKHDPEAVAPQPAATVEPTPPAAPLVPAIDTPTMDSAQQPAAPVQSAPA